MVTGSATEIETLYGNQIRIRVCGICWRDNKLLMVKHRLSSSTSFWSPPGGGLTFAESLQDCLKREFKEETGILVEPKEFQFGCEFIQNPLHAVELFFEVNWISGELITGYDPELNIIEAVRFFDFEELKALEPRQLHGIFQLVKSGEELKSLTGFQRI